MVNTNRIAEIGRLMGEPARVSILDALLDGRALTARELAGVAAITPQTASSHLSRLTTAGLLTVEKQGRHRYHRLASPDVANLLENIMQFASAEPANRRRKLVFGPRDAAMRLARSCYDHFAGRLGVAITDGLIAMGAVEFGDESGLVTPEGVKHLRRVGIDLENTLVQRRRSSRPLCRPCLDWSERRHHVAGRLGAAISTHYLDNGYVRRIGSSRTLTITPRGRLALHDMFGVRDLQ